jgi:uncharacterized protein (DUF1800 family)
MAGCFPAGQCQSLCSNIVVAVCYIEEEPPMSSLFHSSRRLSFSRPSSCSSCILSLAGVLLATIPIFLTATPAQAQRDPGPSKGGIGGIGRNVSVPPTTIEAVRFLEQCTFGATKADIDKVKSIGYEAYLTEQFSAPVSNYYYTAYTPYSLDGAKMRFFQNAVRGQDQLRQRLAFALSQVLVASGGDNVFPTEYKLPAMIAYQETLAKNALGNYRDMLYDMTLNPTMGAYLNMVNNAKPNVTANSQPNENYARELLQLFSLGVYKLNDDGTKQTDSNGDPVPTYGNEEVTQYARVFTGWTYSPAPNKSFTGFVYTLNFTQPMALWAPQHDTGAKTLLNGVTRPALTAGIPTNTNNTALQDYAKADLNAAIDSIFNHPNLGPFVCTRLIQHLVTANPTPGYVYRMTQVFNNNGQNVRGDMKAVVRAILMDTEARSNATAQSTDGYGHWRSGILFITNILRQLEAQGDLGGTSTAGIEGWAFNMRQDPMSPPSVFSFYKPETTIITAPSGNGQTIFPAPETQTLTTESAIRRINFVHSLLFATLPMASGSSKYSAVTAINIADYEAAATNTNTLLDLVNERILHGSMSSGMRTQLATAVNATPATTSANITKRAKTALYLAFCSNENQVQR